MADFFPTPHSTLPPFPLLTPGEKLKAEGFKQKPKDFFFLFHQLALLLMDRFGLVLCWLFCCPCSVVGVLYMFWSLIQVYDLQIMVSHSACCLLISFLFSPCMGFIFWVFFFLVGLGGARVFCYCFVFGGCFCWGGFILKENIAKSSVKELIAYYLF